jgi:hypothetical protein
MLRIALRYEEQLIYAFLKASPKSYFAPVEIAKKAGGRRMFDENPRWAAPLLPRMREMDIIDQNDDGAYRYVTDEEREEREKKKRKKLDRAG